MKRSLVLLAVLSLLSITLLHAGVATVAPEKPKKGDTVTLTYDPAAEGAVHKDAADVYAVVLFVNPDGLPSMLEQKMTKTGAVWSTSFPLSDPKAVGFVFRFDAGDATDDNGANAWTAMVYDAKGKPVRGAQMIEALVRLSRNFYGFKHPVDSAAAKSLLAAERKQYPDQWRAATLSWSMMFKADPGPQTVKQVKKELDALYKKYAKDEEAVREFVQWFHRTEQSKKAEELEASMLKKNPNGKFAEMKAQQALMTEVDPAKRAALVTEFIGTFAVQPGSEPLFLSAYIRAKELEKAAAFLDKYPNVSANYYNNVAYAMITGGKVEEGTALAKKGLDRITESDVRTALDFIGLNRSSWKSNVKYLRGMIADTYGDGLMRLGRHAEAVAPLEESYALMEGDDPENAARLAECYVKTGRNDKAMEVSFGSLVKGKGSPALLEQYRTAYTAMKGSAAGFDSVVAYAKGQMSVAMKEKLKKEWLDKPSVDFELKSLDGTPVKLSALKGKVVVLDFWATWCGPCLSSFPSLQKVYDKYKGNPDIVILAMNTWERVAPEQREQHVKDFIAKNKYTFPVVFDTDIVTKYGVEGIPTKFFIGRNGQVRFKDVGFSGAQEMEDKMDLQFEMLLAETAAK